MNADLHSHTYVMSLQTANMWSIRRNTISRRIRTLTKKQKKKKQMFLFNLKAEDTFLMRVLKLHAALGFICPGALGRERLHRGGRQVGKSQERCGDCTRGRSGAAKEQAFHCSCTQLPPKPEQMVHSHQGGSALSAVHSLSR